MFWHGGFPLFVIAYALLGNGRDTPKPVARRGAVLRSRPAWWSFALRRRWADLAHDGRAGRLPPIMQGNGYTPR